MDALYRYARHLTREARDAEDLLQDTFVKAFRFFDSYEPGTNCKAWLFRIMTNSFLKAKRRNVREFSFVENMDVVGDADGPGLPERVTGERDPERAMLRHVIHEEVRAALYELPADFRTVVLLADLQGFSYKEIAEVMECPVGTVMSRLFRARKALQKRLLGYALEQGYITAPPRERRRRTKGDAAPGEPPATVPEAPAGGSASGSPTSLEDYRARRRHTVNGD